MVKKHMIAHGRVQGVGFRAAVKQLATELDINGWVKNKHDGTVEVEATGDPGQLEKLEQELKAGPTPFAKVNHLDVSDAKESDEYTSFSIRS
ncbi:acylphosphatase [Halobacillus locisalis]|uniref:acylphosphatase n=1 Tax=Halobacillus locisalis TaxID=220753 RepID=A0A838CPR9_9BACI|nr:acylphosphatase [Halobacillus locisalis]MBA2173954.1 acylphosphatase [Halobacillus locisalis]